LQNKKAASRTGLSKTTSLWKDQPRLDTKNIFAQCAVMNHKKPPLSRPHANGGFSIGPQKF
jgi:hypothetical protein